ncbi:glutamine synthetase/guanido kinase [Gonapodya prolifera JEL478]|uniref:Glutamine synthetase n=1 Tax=Gonapodya prolifera (strain JEL478) TaxID=1344416 RepID=A0A139A0B6_GONPJ|nr:glutamine synthetase/guanido kinase [Gonapodya prolifera JEL478]|eukprot:KXS10164.1 glutamine synthetase/guanido kinase [Gonapodya prolifera JEL478]
MSSQPPTLTIDELTGLLASTSVKEDQVDLLHKRLVADGIRFVRMAYLDNSGMLRMYVYPIKKFFRDIAKKGRALTPFTAGMTFGYDDVAFDVFFGEPSTSYNNIVEPKWIPDLTTLRYLGYRDHAVVIGDLVEKDTGNPWPLCSRNFLKQMTKELSERHGLKFVTGTESEFYLFQHVDVGSKYIVPLDTAQYGDPKSYYGKVGKLFDDILVNLGHADIGVYDAHSEEGPGQYEIASEPLEVLEACWELALTREIVRGTAEEHGLRGTFAPRPAGSSWGTGAHVHFSLVDEKTGKNILHDPSREHGMSERAEKFLAGITKHLKGMAILGLPTHASYARVNSAHIPGCVTAWGNENRNAALRVCSPATHIEVRFADATSNPFLVTGALLAAGLQGLDENIPLPPPLQGLGSDLSAEDRKARGIDVITKSFEESLENFEKDTYLVGKMGKLGQAIIKVKKLQHELHGDKTAAEVQSLAIERF